MAVITQILMQQSLYLNAPVGENLILAAKADEGYKFKEWKNADTGEIFSTESVISFEPEETMNLVAVFVADAQEDEDGNNEYTPEEDHVPATADRALATVVAMAALSSLGVAVVSVRKRKERI